MEDAVFMELCRLDEPASTSRSVWLSRASCIMNRQPCIRLWSADTIYYANQPPASLDQHCIAKAHIIRELLYRLTGRQGSQQELNWTFLWIRPAPVFRLLPIFYLYVLCWSLSHQWYMIQYWFQVLCRRMPHFHMQNSLSPRLVDEGTRIKTVYIRVVKYH